MKCLLFLCLLFVLCVYADSSVKRQTCSSIGVCVNCTESGCNWCSTQNQASFCTSATTASSANCDNEGIDEMDQFITNTPDCNGGCQSAENCNECSMRAGCGYCTMGSTQGCLPGTVQAPYAGCTVWTVGTCILPCNGRTDCASCMNGQKPCAWCATGTGVADGTCEDSDGAAASCYTMKTQCPVVTTATGAQLTLTLVPLIALLAMLL